ncbi:MAG: hypothetical protein QXX34_04565 [Candidatus Bathyarchaeia archaeon]
MSQIAKYSAALVMFLLTLTIISSLLMLTSAQENQEEIIIPRPPPFPPSPSADQATVIVSATEGGTTNPLPGTHYYWNNTVIRLTAIPNEGYRFLYWAISGAYTPGHSVPPLIIPGPVEVDGEIVIPPVRPPTPSTYDSLIVTQNPLNVICGYGYTFEYQAVFYPTTPTGTERADAIVVVKEAIGGSTNPGPGTYTFANGSSITLTATPNEGQKFLYWIATGSGISGHGESTVLLQNPLTVTCGIGYVYEYLPVFAPVESLPSTGIPIEYFYATVVVLAIVIVLAVAFALMYIRKK